MRNRTKFVARAALVALMLQLVATPSMAMEGTMVIDTPGTVILTHDYQGNIVITSDDVVLDCDGHTVEGPGDGEGISLLSVSNVSLVNCRITGFAIGVYVSGGGFNEIRGNVVLANHDSQIRLENSDDNVITDNEASGGAFGIILFGSSSNTITGNSVMEQLAIGIGLENGSNSNRVTDNDGRMTAGGSVYTVVPSHDNTLKNNLADGGFDGFYLEGATGNELVANTSVNAANVGFTLAPGSDDNVVKDNVADGYQGNGFQVRESARNLLQSNRAFGGAEAFWVQRAMDTTFKSNTATDSGVGFFIWESTSNLLQGNSVQNAGVFGIQIWDSTAHDVRGNTVAGAWNIGILILDSNDVSVSGNLATGSPNHGFNINASTNVEVVGNRATSNRVGMVVSRSAHVTVHANDLPRNSTGMIINETLDGDFQKNRADHNTDFGFRMTGTSANNELTKNSACHNGIFDAIDESTGPNSWHGNDFCSSDIG